MTTTPNAKPVNPTPMPNTKTPMQSTKPQFDPNSPQIKAYLKDVQHQFVREGMMVAFPTCLPGVTMPIPLEESRITAIDINSDGHIYGGTSASSPTGKAHVFASAFHGLTGIVLDTGTIPDAQTTVAVCCLEVREPRDEDSDDARKAARAWPGAIAFVNPPAGSSAGGRAIAVPHIELIQDWIQEWGMEPQSPWDLGECVAGEPVVHAVSLPGGTRVVGLTTHHLFTLDAATGKVSVIGEVPGRSRIVLGRSAVFGLDDGAKLWSYDFASGKLHRSAISLPAGDWADGSLVRWARDTSALAAAGAPSATGAAPAAPRNDAAGSLAIADAAGHLFLFDDRAGKFRLVGQTHLAPVNAMALTPDGRIFGACGTEIANLFVCDPRSSASPQKVAPPVGLSPADASARNLGVAASVLETRRLAYQFSYALTGPSGEIILAEDDHDAHLWLYFPRI